MKCNYMEPSVVEKVKAFVLGRIIRHHFDVSARCSRGVTTPISRSL
jgi:hypothetical protein